MAGEIDVHAEVNDLAKKIVLNQDEAINHFRRLWSYETDAQAPGTLHATGLLAALEESQLQTRLHGIVTERVKYDCMRVLRWLENDSFWHMLLLDMVGLCGMEGCGSKRFLTCLKDFPAVFADRQEAVEWLRRSRKERQDDRGRSNRTRDWTPQDAEQALKRKKAHAPGATPQRLGTSASTTPLPSPTGPSPARPSPTRSSPTRPSPTRPSPTRPSPTRSSPTRSSPTRSSPTGPSPACPSPTRPSPTRSSPTRSSLTRSSPTRTSPTRSSPTRSSPSHSPSHSSSHHSHTDDQQSTEVSPEIGRRGDPAELLDDCSSVESQAASGYEDDESNDESDDNHDDNYDDNFDDNYDHNTDCDPTQACNPFTLQSPVGHRTFTHTDSPFRFARRGQPLSQVDCSRDYPSDTLPGFRTYAEEEEQEGEDGEEQDGEDGEEQEGEDGEEQEGGGGEEQEGEDGEEQDGEDGEEKDGEDGEEQEDGEDGEEQEGGDGEEQEGEDGEEQEHRNATFTSSQSSMPKRHRLEDVLEPPNAKQARTSSPEGTPTGKNRQHIYTFLSAIAPDAVVARGRPKEVVGILEEHVSAQGNDERPPLTTKCYGCALLSPEPDTADTPTVLVAFDWNNCSGTYSIYNPQHLEHINTNLPRVVQDFLDNLPHGLGEQLTINPFPTPKSKTDVTDNPLALALTRTGVGSSVKSQPIRKLWGSVVHDVAAPLEPSKINEIRTKLEAYDIHSGMNASPTSERTSSDTIRDLQDIETIREEFTLFQCESILIRKIVQRAITQTNASHASKQKLDPSVMRGRYSPAVQKLLQSAADQERKEQEEFDTLRERLQHLVNDLNALSTSAMELVEGLERQVTCIKASLVQAREAEDLALKRLGGCGRT